MALRRTCPPCCRPRSRSKPPFSWLRLKSLTGGRRNDPLAKLLGDPSHEQRQAWLNQMYGDGTPDLTIDRTDLDAPSFLLLGDTGEGDISQYAPMSIIESVAAGTDFMVICSDVIYPAGGTLEYAYKHCWPYRDYPRPIYALPGNHDWYDSLRGFMAYFCGQTSVAAPPSPVLVQPRWPARPALARGERAGRSPQAAVPGDAATGVVTTGPAPRPLLPDQYRPARPDRHRHRDRWNDRRRPGRLAAPASAEAPNRRCF